MIDRRLTRKINVGSITIGGGSPISVQSMTKTDTRDVAATVNQIKELEASGCEIVRIAIPDEEAAEAIPGIRRRTSVPLIADIHFEYRLAIMALQAGFDGIRLNPGNIKEPEHLASIVELAKLRRVPIRIGVNAGSLPSDLDPSVPVPERMVAATLRYIRLFEDMDFDLIKLSIKAFDVPTTVQAYRTISEKTDYPLHLGITESGLPKVGSIRSAVGLGILLYQGIGDTIRVSLSGPPTEEVAVGLEILKSLNLRYTGPTLVSCPSCGRTEFDILGLARMVDAELNKITIPIKVAVMGCIVNGPGEARDADVGIACGKGRGAIFRNGEVVRTVNEVDAFQALMEEIQQFVLKGQIKYYNSRG